MGQTSHLWSPQGRAVVVSPADDPRFVTVNGVPVLAEHMIEAAADAAGLTDVGPWLDMHAVATELGLTYTTVRTYRAKGKFPDPDHVFGKAPVWRPSTIRRYKEKTQS